MKKTSPTKNTSTPIKYTTIPTKNTPIKNTTIPTKNTPTKTTLTPSSVTTSDPVDTTVRSKTKYTLGSLPKNSHERRHYLEALFKNIDIYNHVIKAPARKTSKVEDMAAYLAKFSKEPLERAVILFLWMSENIRYDFDSYISGKSSDVTPDGVFKNGLTVCSGYARTFAKLGSIMELEIENISGYAKGYGYKPGQKCDKTNHEWNAIKLYGNWYLLDSTWGTGHIINNHFEKRFKPYYILCGPELLIDSHHPENDKWQLSDKVVSLKDFENAPLVNYKDFYSHVWCEGITLVSHNGPLIDVNSQSLTIKLKFPDKTTKLLPKLKLGEKECENMTQYQYNSDEDNYEIDILFPSEGEYTLTIFARNNSTPGSNYNSIIDFKIHNSDKSKRGLLGFPYCYNAAICHLFEPTNLYLPIGKKVFFKMNVKGASQVSIITNGNKWNYLDKKEGDLFEGNVDIDLEDVKVFAKIGEGGSFSGVYAYKGTK